MIDRVETIKGLVEAIQTIVVYVPERYWGRSDKACRDAVLLLKEMAPVKPKRKRCATGAWYSDCGACGSSLVRWGKFCPTCGKEVNWDGA